MLKVDKQLTSTHQSPGSNTDDPSTNSRTNTPTMASHKVVNKSTIRIAKAEVAMTAGEKPRQISMNELEMGGDSHLRAVNKLPQ